MPVRMTPIPDEVKFGFEDPYGIGVDISTVTGQITPKEIWDNKNVWFEAAKKSREDWENMTTDQREAVERMVKGSLERMHDRVSDWVPEGLTTVAGGDFLDIHMKILFTDIDKEIDRNEQATSFQIASAEAELREQLGIEDDQET